MGMLKGKDFTFEKPYINMLAESIANGTSVSFEDNVSQSINETSDVKKFLKAVEKQNISQINVVTKSGTSFLPIFNGYRWTQIDKSQFSGRGDGGLGRPDGKTTAMQENASLLAIQKGIENNGYKNKETFLKLYRKDLLKEYPGMDEYWENVFFEQQKLTQQKVGNTQYGHYSRDDGFMEYITERCKTLYGINKKDTWNPADIWLVSDLEKSKRELDSKILDNSTSLMEFNTILQDMFHKRQVVGISLKKMSGKSARWELVNFSGEEVFDSGEYSFSFDEAKLNLKSTSRGKFENTESSFKISSSKVAIAFQIRQNSPGFNNLKLEGTDISARSARLGKAPLDMVSATLRSYGVGAKESTRWRSWRNYPKDIDDFLNEQEIHVKRFNSLKSTGRVELGIKTAEEFVDTVVSVFDNSKTERERAVVNSKLQQLDLLNEIFSIRDINKLSDLLSDISYLGQKKGAVFGPFAKLY